jgi:hypothetical protein
MECGLTSAIQFQSDVKTSVSSAGRAQASRNVASSQRNTSVFAACALGCGFAVVSAFGAAPARAHFESSSQLEATLSAVEHSSALTPASNPGDKSKKKSAHAAKKSSKKSHDSDELASTKKPKAAKASGAKPAEETSMNAASDDPLEGL